ncbi:MAG: hypothetical protein KC501_31545, partial [Myxococcales bacterium]|nr:hypothetical protein [Myxococcales bacterium]
AVAERALELEPSRVVRSGLAPLVSALGAAAAELCERIAGVHLMAERRQEARGVLGLLVEVDPSELSRRLRLAELDLSLGRIDEARVGLRLVADGLRAHGRTTELLRVLEMMHRHTGPDEAVLRELAAIYLRCGQPRRALEKLEALHRVAPHDRMAVERLAREHARLGRLEISLRLLERLIALVVEQAERGELRAVLRRASSWSSDSSYQRVVESLGLAALRPGGVSVDARSLRGPDPRVGPRVGTRRWSSPPPLPRAMRRSARARAASGEIHILDPEADAELIVEPVVLGAEGSAVLALE